jgi:hypothetical protein
MQLRRLVLLAAAIGLANAAAQTPQANTPASAQQPAGSEAVIKTETRVVLVDAVVTGKKGEYIRDLTAKDFRVLEDNAEQKITSFSFEADPNSPANSQKRYLVLFFDNSTMDFAAQGRAREAAAKFIDANTGPNRLMAVVNYGGTVQLAQNFTADTERLKQVVAGEIRACFAERQQPHERARGSGFVGHAFVGQCGGKFWRMGRAAGAAQHGQKPGIRARPQEPGAVHGRFYG